MNSGTVQLIISLVSVFFLLGTNLGAQQSFGDVTIDEPDAVVLASDGVIYWTDAVAGTLSRFDPESGSARTIVTDLIAPLGLAFDESTGRLYFSELGTGSIYTVATDGGEKRVFLADAGAPAGIALAADRLYWADASGEIRYTALTAPRVELLVSDGITSPRDVAVDSATGRIYWTDGGRDVIGSVDPDGEGVRFLESAEFLNVVALTVCGADELIYLTDDGADAIYSVSIDSGAVDFLYKPFHPTGITAACSDETVVWADIATHTVYGATVGRDAQQRAVFPPGPSAQ